MPVVVNLIKGSTDFWVKEGIGGYMVKNFDTKLWTKKIKLALKISNKTLRENSSKIIKIASTKNIDSEYYKKIKAIK